MIAVVGLTVAVVIVANERDDVSNTSALKPAESVNQPSGPGAARYDGGPEEGTRGISSPAAAAALSTHRPADGSRYDGGPEEGTRGLSAPSRGSVALKAESPRGPGFSTD